MLLIKMNPHPLPTMKAGFTDPVAVLTKICEVTFQRKVKNKINFKKNNKQPCNL